MILMRLLYFNLFYVILLFLSVLTDSASTQISPNNTTYQATETNISYTTSIIPEISTKPSFESTSSTTSEIQPITTYQTVQTTTIGYSMSGSVTNLSIINSSFPSSPLIITWNPPQTPNGEIVQYFIWVQNSTNNNNQCVLILTMNCTGCTNNITIVGLPNNNIIGCRTISGSTFSSSATTLSITVNDSTILPYTDYIIHVIPLNGYGWGNSTNKSFKTNQYVSGSVSNLSINSSFPSYPLSITWMPPQTPNGEIVQYFIWVQNSINNNNNYQCVLKMFIDCINCQNNISDNNLPDKSIDKCKEITRTTFNSSNIATLSIIINDSMILPYTDYIINVIPLNGYGWGTLTNKSIKTNQYKSSGISNLAVISVNQSNILQLSWEMPLNPNGKIIHYFIWIQKMSNIDECVLKMVINCTDCVDDNNMLSTVNFTDTRVDNCKQIVGPTFTSINTTFSITINDSNVLSYSNYTIYVTPLNGFGWGDTISKLFSTPSYISGPVENLIINSSFPQYPVKISWETPRYPNGEIVKYLIWVQNTNGKCVLSKSIVCTSCNNNGLLASWPDNSTYECNTTNQESFNSSNTSFAVIITDLRIRPDTQYFINISPLNGYGWGQSVSRKIATTQYAPDPVQNLQSLVQQTTITITWNPPKIHSSNFYYFIQISNQTFNRNYSLQTNLTRFSLNDLEYCSDYEICIRVVDDYNLPSSIQCINQSTDSSTASINVFQKVSLKDKITVFWNYLSYSNCLYFATLSINNTPAVETPYNYYQFINLKPATPYTINITPFTYNKFRNVSFAGSVVSFSINTLDDIPSPVVSFNCSKLSYTSMICEWKQPEVPNGKIVNYWISCKSEFLIYNSTLLSTSINITEGIVTDKLYICQINASTSVGYGPSSLSSLTIKPAPIPEILDYESISTVMTQSNIKVTDEYTQLSITLPYSHFTNNFGTIQKFTLVISQIKSDILTNNSFPFISANSYQNQAYGACAYTNPCTYEIHLPEPKVSIRIKRATNDQSSWLNAGYIIGNNKTSGNISDYYSNGPLSSGTSYVIGFRAYTSAGFITVGFIPMNTVANKIAIIIGVTVAAIVITCVIIAIYFRIRYKRDKKPSEPVKLLPTDNKSPAVNEFQANYEFMKKDSNGRLIDDFLDIKDQSLQLERQRILEFTEGNETKNRFSNIKPYKHNRVKLGGGNDYINASRICVKHWNNELSNQCACNNIYIATQGPIGENKDPKLCTIGDFWRMIMENNVGVIVNLTRVEEHGKEKCSQYWPSEINKIMTYFSNDESIDVTLQNFTDYINYVERVFQVTMNKKKVSVTQLHMLAWLDHSCPKISDFLKFYENYQKVRRNYQSVVVHCSAGVGRTGTFIMIDEELSRISKETDKIEIFHNLLKLRKQRCQMVQTDSQYCFIYTIVHEYLVQLGLVKVPKDRSNSYVFRQSYVNPIFVE